MEKPNVLYISPNGYLGGAERFVLTALKEHKKSGQINAQVLFLNSGEAYQEALQIGVPCRLLPFKLRLRNPLSLIKAVKFLKSYLIENKISLIHSTMPYAHILAALSTKGLKVKKAWFQHGPCGGIFDQLANRFKADRIYFNSTFLQELHNKNSYANKDLSIQKIISLPISKKDFSKNEIESKRKELILQKNFLISHAGRVCTGKGQLEFLRSIVKLRNKNEALYTKCQFIVSGKPNSEDDKKYLTELKTFKFKNNLENVSFLGHQDNLGLILAASDLFVHSSTLPEAFGMIIAEAMLQETLVVSHVNGGMKDILKHKETGLVYDYESASWLFDLAGLIEEGIRVVESGDRRILDKAKTLVENKYSTKLAVGLLEKDYLR